MSDYSKKTKAELIEELQRLKTQEIVTADSNGSFDEDELFELVKGQDGDELFVVTETGRFVYMNDTLIQRLGYALSEMSSMTLARIDKTNTRANWLHRVSRIKQSRIPDIFDTEFIDAAGWARAKEVSANYVNLRGKNYILCVSKDSGDTMENGAANAVAKSREQVFIQTTSDGILIVDTRGTIIESNSIADRMLGTTKNQIISRSCADPRWRMIDTDGQQLSVSSHPIMIALVEEHPAINRKVGMIQPDGSRRYITINAAPLFDPEGRLSGAIGCLRLFEDSAERNEALKRDAMLARMQAEVVKAVLEAHSEDDLERQVCDILVRHAEYALVWRGVTKANDMRIHPTASSGKEEDYLRKIKVRYDESEYGIGPIGKAMKTLQPVAVPDIVVDPDSEAWIKQTEKTNLHSLAALPLVYDGCEVGVLVLYSRDRNHFVGPEYERLKEIARVVGFGVGIRRKLKTDQERIGNAVFQERLVEAYQSSLPVALAVFDAREPFRCLQANAHFSNLLDEPFRTRGIEGQNVSDVVSSLYHRDLYDRLVESMETVQPASRSCDIFTDWEGKQSQWSWTITPLEQGEHDTQLLYLAWRHESSTDSGASTDDAAPETTAKVEHAESSKPESGVISVDFPKFSPRSRIATRLQRFLDEGQVTALSSGAAAWLDATAPAPARARDVFSADERIQTLLGAIVVSKEQMLRLKFPAAASEAVADVTAFFSTDDDIQKLWMFFSAES